MRNLFLQVPRITEEESNRLDQSHQDENGDEDELVVVGQGRILEEVTIKSIKSAVK